MITRTVVFGMLAALAGGCGGGANPRAEEKPRPREDLQLRLMLAELSEFARDVNSGRTTLRESRQRKGQPDRLMMEVRVRVHHYPEAGRQVLAYLRSQDVPLQARALVVAALADPDSSEVLRIMSSLIDDPPDMALVWAWAAGFSSYRSSDWGLSFQALPVDSGPGWRLPDNGGIGQIQEPGRHGLNSLDFVPLLESLLRLLERRDVGVARALALDHAMRFSRDRGATEEHRRLLRELVQRSYLEKDEAWNVAYERIGDLEVLGRGLPGLDNHRLMLVLDEIAHRTPEALVREPFRAYIERTLRYLALDRNEGGPYEGSLQAICWALLSAPGADARANFMLFESPSLVLRRKSVQSMENLLYRDRTEWKPWKERLEKLSRDSDFLIARIASWILEQESKPRH